MSERPAGVPDAAKQVAVWYDEASGCIYDRAGLYITTWCGLVADEVYTVNSPQSKQESSSVSPEQLLSLAQAGISGEEMVKMRKEGLL